MPDQVTPTSAPASMPVQDAAPATPAAAPAEEAK